MKTGKILSFTGMVIMFVSIVSGFLFGDFLGEGSIIVAPIWGKISLIDVYIGFLIFYGWIFYRETSTIKRIVWLVLVLVLGNFTTCLYLYYAFRKSDGNWNKFWNGERVGA